MSLEKTLTGNTKVRLNTQYPVVAGADKDGVPRLLKVDENGVLIGGGNLPDFDNFIPTYLPGTNNIDTLIYYLNAVEVARWTFTYVGGGVANNDLVASGTLLIA